MSKIKKIITILILSIFLFSLVSSMSFHPKPLDSFGNVQPSTSFSYEFNFTDNVDCTSVVLSNSSTIITGQDGVGFLDVNISSLTTVPSYLCEYKSGSLRKTHTFSDIIFRKIFSKNILTENLNSTDIYTDNLIVNFNVTANKGFFNEINSTNITTTNLNASGNIYTSLTKDSIPFIGDSGVLTEDNSAFFRNSTDGSLNMAGSILPNETNGYDLGSEDAQWNSLYLANDLQIHGAIVQEAKAGEDLEACRLVYGSGATGNKKTVYYADNRYHDSSHVYGFTTEAVSSGETVHIAVAGELRVCDTIGIANDEILHLRQNGTWQIALPNNGSGVHVGQVSKQNAGAGIILIQLESYQHHFSGTVDLDLTFDSNALLFRDYNRNVIGTMDMTKSLFNWTGNITSSYFIGDGSQLTGIDEMDYTNVAMRNESNDMQGNNFTNINYLQSTTFNNTGNVTIGDGDDLLQVNGDVDVNGKQTITHSAVGTTTALAVENTGAGARGISVTVNDNNFLTSGVAMIFTMRKTGSGTWTGDAKGINVFNDYKTNHTTNATGSQTGYSSIMLFNNGEAGTSPFSAGSWINYDASWFAVSNTRLFDFNTPVSDYRSKGVTFDAGNDLTFTDFRHFDVRGSVAGQIDNETGYYSEKLTRGTNNIQFLSGTSPSNGNYSFYEDSDYPNYFSSNTTFEDTITTKDLNITGSLLVDTLGSITSFIENIFVKNVTIQEKIILSNSSTDGIMVDINNPTYPWRDLLGEIRTRGVGATDPNDAVYSGGIRAFEFVENDEFWVNYHIPHDYVNGTDTYLHFHWSHNVGVVTGGSVNWSAEVIYAKGHDQMAFTTPIQINLTCSASTIQYQHMICETQLSNSGGTGGMIDTNLLEPDGVIMIRGFLQSNDITSSGAVPDPFLHFQDIHYQSFNIGTKNKEPGFYG